MEGRLRLLAWVVAVVFLASLAGIRYVTTDDIWGALWTFDDDWFRAGYDLAAHHGRLFKPASLALFVPYAIDHPAWYLLTYIGPIVAAAVLAARLVAKAVPVPGAAPAFLLLFFALAQNSSHTSLFSAVPFVWEMTWVTFLLGALALWRAIDTGRLPIAIAGSIVYVLGLAEGFVPHAVLLVAVLAWAPGGWRRNLRYVLPYVIALAAWMVAWIAWRHVHPPQYDGAMFSSDVSPWRIVRTIAVFAFGGAPFNTLVGDVVVADVRTFREGFGVAWCVKAAATGAGAYLWSRAAAASPWRPGWRLLVFVAALVVLPVMLLGMTGKYQHWVDVGSRGYVHSHYAYFAWIALIVILWVPIARHLLASRGAALGAALIVAMASIVTDWSNHEINLQQKLSARKWDTMDQVFRSVAFAAIPAGATVLYDGLDRFRGIAATDASYWQRYARVRTGQERSFVPAHESAAVARKDLYLVVFHDAPRTDEQYVVVARQDPDGELWATRDFSVIVSSRQNEGAVAASLRCDGACLPSIVVNDVPMAMPVPGSLFVPSPIPPSGQLSVHVRLDGGDHVDARSVRMVFDRATGDSPDAMTGGAALRDGIFGDDR